MPRLYREVPLNSIWEGSGNVNCLDVLRGMVRSPGSVDAFFDEVEQASLFESSVDQLQAGKLKTIREILQLMKKVTAVGP